MRKRAGNFAKPSLLIYAHYYYPDIASTGQILKDLAEGMFNDFNITVICVVPSYGGSVNSEYKNKKYYFENINGINVIRVRVPDFDKTNKSSRIKNILIYFFRAIWATGKLKNVDYVFSISQPPILGGLIGVLGKWLKNAKYIYNIQDFNPEQIIATGYSKNRIILKWMMDIDKYSCKKASKVIVVGRDMVETLEERFKKEKVPNYAYINNWIDEKEIYPMTDNEEHVVAFRKKYGLLGKYVIMYSGNIGLYYDLENLIKIAEKFKNQESIKFAFVGTGCIKEKLVKYKEKHHLDNVVFIPYQRKKDLIYSLNSGDLHWCMNAKGIKGVSVPSKLYGIMAVGKPILGVLEKGSEARLIIEEARCGFLAEPGDYETMELNIKKFMETAGSDEQLQMGKSGRNYLVCHLMKKLSISKYIKEIKTC